jgi:hypothetical protein
VGGRWRDRGRRGSRDRVCDSVRGGERKTKTVCRVREKGGERGKGGK